MDDKPIALHIKQKNTDLHIAKKMITTGVDIASEQVEGANEIRDAANVAGTITRPVSNVASGTLSAGKKVVSVTRRIKRAELRRKIVRDRIKKAARKTAKETAKKVSKETTKAAVKTTVKTTTSVATSVAGTALAPGLGTAIGIGAGAVAGAAIEKKDRQMSRRSMMVKAFLSGLKTDEDGSGNAGIVQIIKAFIVGKLLMAVKFVASFTVVGVVAMALLNVLVLTPVIIIVVTFFNSPFALFLPNIDFRNPNDTVPAITSEYLADFNEEINDILNNHDGYDDATVVYLDYEGSEANPSNYYDIMAVYMVRYGIGDTATVMNGISKARLKNVVKDMCKYYRSTETEDIEVINADGSTGTKTVKHLYINVTLKYYRDMITLYGFGDDEIELLEQMMDPELMGLLDSYQGENIGGGTSSGGSVSKGTSSLTDEEINTILAGISDSTLRAACSYALNRVGYPYSQQYRDTGNYYDCSSLTYYSWKSAGKNIAYAGATTAATQAEGLEKSGKTVSYDDIRPGDLIFYSFTKNGRYKDISHVAIYVGDGKLVEALNEKSGVTYRNVYSKGNIVLIGRPQ